MREQLLDAFPEFNLIGAPSLKDLALDVYEDALKQGGWSIEDMDRIPFTLLIPDVDVSYTRHVRGVTAMCHAMASAINGIYGDRMTLDMDILITGALLHDIGKLAEFAEVDGKFVKSVSGMMLRHPFSGVALCARHDVPEAILHIIAVHSREGDGFRRTPEAIILHHADFANFEPLKK